jgi:hypothetical protein
MRARPSQSLAGHAVTRSFATRSSKMVMLWLRLLRAGKLAIGLSLCGPTVGDTPLPAGAGATLSHPVAGSLRVRSLLRGAFWVRRRVRNVLGFVDDDIDDFGEHTPSTIELLSTRRERAPKDAHQDQGTDPTDRHEETDQPQDDRRRKQGKLSDTCALLRGRSPLSDKSALAVSSLHHLAHLPAIPPIPPYPAGIVGIKNHPNG